MCPQADLSHAFLGNDENNNDYVSQIGTLKKDSMLIGDQKIPKTISGYMDLATSTILLAKNIVVDPRTFLINVSKFNPSLPRNIYLLCGDASLELMARSLDQKRNQNSSVSQFGQYAWKSVTCCLKQFIRKIAERKGIKLVVFIDSNASFSILTEIALAASDKLIIPITDDHFHRNGFEYMFALLYGFSQPSDVYYYYRHFSFYYRALEHDVKLPKIHLILYRNLSTTSLTTSGDSEWEIIYDLFRKHSNAFNYECQTDVQNENDNENHQQQLLQQQQQKQQLTLEEFKAKFVIDISVKESTNNLLRQAIRTHSPLNIKYHGSLSAMSSNHSPQVGLTSCNTSPSLFGTPKSFKTRNPSPARHPKRLTANFSTDTDSSTGSNATNSRMYPLQHQRHFTSRPILNDNLTSLNKLSLNDNNSSETLEENDAVLFDKILNNIVSSLKD